MWSGCQLQKSITQCRGEFVYPNGTFPEVYTKESNKSMKSVETLQKLCEDTGIPENLKSDSELVLYGR